MRGEVGPINMATVLFTVVLVKPRETLPEPERSPLGGGTVLFFFQCLNSMFPLVPSAGSNQETELHEELTSSFYRTNNATSCQSKGDHPSHGSFYLSLGGGGGGRWPEGHQFKWKSGLGKWKNCSHTWIPLNEVDCSFMFIALIFLLLFGTIRAAPLPPFPWQRGSMFYCSNSAPCLEAVYDWIRHIMWVKQLSSSEGLKSGSSVTRATSWDNFSCRHYQVSVITENHC